MKFASSYEPNQYESDIYAAWEAAGVFAPTEPTIPVDDDGDGIDDRLEKSEDNISQHCAGSDSQNYNGHESESGTIYSGEDSPDCCNFDDREPSTLRNITSDST